MAEQVQRRATPRRDEPVDDLVEHRTDTEADKARREALVATTDALLDEIDDLVADIEAEGTVEQFVAGFVQKGGE